MMMTLVDKSGFSLCGLKCGFILDTPLLFNPIDQFMLSISNVIHSLSYSYKLFPMDLIASLVMYSFLCLSTLYGVLKLGSDKKGFYVLPIKKSSVLPNTLFIVSCICSSVGIGLLYNWQIIAPQYSTYGTQTYIMVSTCLLYNNSLRLTRHQHQPDHNWT